MSKRMKQVFTPAMVAHVWAQQTQDEGRTARGNFYFRGTTLYSYGPHFPIAEFVTTKRGRVILVTNRGYSVTTAKHKNYAWRAINGLQDVTVVQVRNPCDIELHSPRSAAKYFRDKIKEQARELLAMRAPYISNLSALNSTIATANEYSHAMGWRWRIKHPMSETQKAALHERITKTVERARLRSAASERRRAAQDAQWKARDEALRLNQQFFGIAWLLGRDELLRDLGRQYDLYGGNMRHGRTLLRVQGDEIETTLGATFPIEHAKKAFRVVAMCREFARPWEAGDKSIALGHFKIESISAMGDVRAGCHFVTWDAIQYCAAQLGLHPSHEQEATQ